VRPNLIIQIIWYFQPLIHLAQNIENFLYSAKLSGKPSQIRAALK
jgi:hypothetical protein